MVVLLTRPFPFLLLLFASGGTWTCPYAMESISTLNWAMGKTGYYPKGYIPEAALAKPEGQRDEEPVRDVEEVFREMEVRSAVVEEV